MASVIPDVVADGGGAWGTTPATSNVAMGGFSITGAGNIDASGQITGGTLASGPVRVSSDAWGARVYTTAVGNLGIGTAGLSDSIQIGATGKVGIKKTAVADLDVNGSLASTSISTGTVTATGNVSCVEMSSSSNANISGSAYITGDASISGNFEATNTQSGTTGASLTFNKRTGPLSGNTVDGTSLGRFDFNGWNTSAKTGAQILAKQDGTAATGVPANLQFYTSDGTTLTERMRIGKDGRVAIGTTPSTYALEVVNKDCPGDAINLSCASTSGYATIRLANGSGTTASLGIEPQVLGGTGRFYIYFSGGHRLFIDRTTGAFSIPGSLSVGTLSKSSGTFKIDHPLKPDTHHLVHSFVEAPKADLNYRGVATLVAGRAVVNIDAVAGMTEGTFVALCRDVQCFTTNESDWTPVRGKVEGNILTIEAQDPAATSEVSWLVIGERKDKHMMETDWTDDDGHVIVEPPKEK